MAMTIYMDESGNSGDVIATIESIGDFHGQPYFTLAGVGLDIKKEARVVSDIEILKKKYGYTGELKSSKNIDFLLDLLNLLYKENCPIFVELMDKKCFIATRITHTILFTTSELPKTKEIFEYARQVTEMVYHHLSDTIFEEYCKVAKNPDNDSFLNLINSLEDELKGWRQNEETQIIADTLLFCCRQVLIDFNWCLIRNDSPKPAYWYFIPPPDYDKKNRIIAFLPHVTAASNIFARMEKYRIDNKIDSILIIHDEQKQFEGIIEDTLNSMKQLPSDAVDSSWLEEKGTFNISSKINLTFDDSKKFTMIQVADVIASLVRRIWQDYMDDGKIPEKYDDLCNVLLDYPLFYKTTGVNYVAPISYIDEFIESS